MSTATNPTSPSAPGAQSGSGNKIDLPTLMARASELGEQAGKGQDTQIKFLLSCFEGGYHNAVDLTKDKHGQDVDDATKLAETYVKAQGTATTFDAKAMNQRKLIATLRTGIKLGQWPKGGNGEPLQTVNNLMQLRQNMRKDPAQRKGLEDAANCFLRYARAQLKSDVLLPDAELRQFCVRPGKDKVTTEERVEAIRNALKKLYAGDRDGIRDASPKVKQAMDAMTDRLVEIAKGKGKGVTP